MFSMNSILEKSVSRVSPLLLTFQCDFFVTAIIDIIILQQQVLIWVNRLSIEYAQLHAAIKLKASAFAQQDQSRGVQLLLINTG